MISFLQYSVHASSILFFNEPTFLLYEINNSISVFSGIPQQHPPINCFLGWQSTEDKFKVCYFGFKNIDISSSNIVLPKSQPVNLFKKNFNRNFPPTIFNYILTGSRMGYNPSIKLSCVVAADTICRHCHNLQKKTTPYSKKERLSEVFNWPFSWKRGNFC